MKANSARRVSVLSLSVFGSERAFVAAVRRFRHQRVQERSLPERRRLQGSVRTQALSCFIGIGIGRRLVIHHSSLSVLLQTASTGTSALARSVSRAKIASKVRFEFLALSACLEAGALVDRPSLSSAACSCPVLQTSTTACQIRAQTAESAKTASTNSCARCVPVCRLYSGFFVIVCCPRRSDLCLLIMLTDGLVARA